MQIHHGYSSRTEGGLIFPHGNVISGRRTLSVAVDYVGRITTLVQQCVKDSRKRG
jgi:hypothetical protein